ncbi:MAG: hypothetical protein JO228_07400, partial [Xanthobacteraceae bacterium]|nr:hypothetical protein [Xanthobacteraceae bacterium]
SLSKLADSRRLKSELEEAIARLEAEAASTGAAESGGEPGAEAAATPDTPGEADNQGPLAAQAEMPDTTAAREPLGKPQPSPAEAPERSPNLGPATASEKAAANLGAIRPGAPIDLDEAASRAAQSGRDRVRTPRQRDPARPAYRVKPSEFANRDQRPARRPAGMVLFGIVIALQLVVAALAGAAFYVAMWGRGAPLRTSERPAPPAEVVAAAPAPARAAAPPMPGPPPATPATPTPEPIIPPVQPAPSAAPLAPPPIAPPAAAPGPRVAAADLSFPLPPAYGVYALVDNKLVELQQVRATPVDPRNAGQLQVLEPGRTVIAPGKPDFVIFRRDLASHPPDKVTLRVAARVAHAMNFDSSGKAIMTRPVTDTWIIRELGYDLRASPVEGNSEMIKLRAEDPALSLPPGRYELMLGGQAFDLTVAGEVTDPAHCVEGVTTVRGQVFNECKPVL